MAATSPSKLNGIAREFLPSTSGIKNFSTNVTIRDADHNKNAKHRLAHSGTDWTNLFHCLVSFDNRIASPVSGTMAVLKTIFPRPVQPAEDFDRSSTETFTQVPAYRHSTKVLK
jgi:hypothetical protein